MSLGIAFIGPEGIVLAADSRVTLTAEMPGGQQLRQEFQSWDALSDEALQVFERELD